MSSDSLNPHYRCVTPPPLPKHKFPTLADPAYTSLISSPVTPQSSHRPPVLDSLHDDERHILNALLKRAQVHRHAENSLLDRIASSGNTDYINNRSVIVEWMSEVSAAFNFLPITLHLAVRHLDWTFASRALPQRYYQLSAIAALFIAAKCEEAGPNVPILDDFRFICDNLYDTKMIRSMELYMLQLLKWDVVAKTPVHFLNHYIWIVMRRMGQARGDGCKANTKHIPTFQNLPRDNPVREVNPLDFMSDDDDDDDDDDVVSVISGKAACNCIGDCICDDCEMSDTSDVEGDIATAEGTLSLPNSICDRSLTTGFNSGRRSKLPEKEGDALFRVAICLLDLSLYDAYVRGRFPPHILAATALSIATEISGDTCLRPCDVAGVTDVSELGMLDCRAVLWKLFKEAQE